MGHFVIHVTFLGHDSCSKVVLSVDSLHLSQSVSKGGCLLGLLKLPMSVEHAYTPRPHAPSARVPRSPSTAPVSQHHLVSDGDAGGIALVLS